MKLVAALLVLAACSRRDEAAQRGPAPAPPPRPVPAATPTPAPTVADRDPCPVRDAELIYVVDAANHLASFDPRKLPGDPFQIVGTLTCNPASRPFSMAVDRAGIAWVLYASGDVYRVSILDARCSKAIYSHDGSAPLLFGMGFVTDGPTTTTEQLYVAADDEAKTFARLDTRTVPARFVRVGAIVGPEHTDDGLTINPELTGTSEGRLFGYFPEDGLGFVQELDRTTGKLLGAPMKLPATAGRVEAFAFAHWGGVFYVFATIGGNSAVHALHGKTGAHELIREHLPDRIVGAGVSTCAPLLEQVP